mmetsp:Transcript_21605/g.50442  ORF Transcript_21605/g.50442 Transcript_21605/m.50442 type:complete len:215 (-) Transcript_21605:1538-2182(-)
MSHSGLLLRMLGKLGTRSATSHQALLVLWCSELGVGPGSMTRCTLGRGSSGRWRSRCCRTWCLTTDQDRDPRSSSVRPLQGLLASRGRRPCPSKRFRLKLKLQQPLLAVQQAQERQRMLQRSNRSRWGCGRHVHQEAGLEWKQRPPQHHRRQPQHHLQCSLMTLRRLQLLLRHRHLLQKQWRRRSLEPLSVAADSSTRSPLPATKKRRRQRHSP